MSQLSQKLSLCLLSMGAVSAAGVIADATISPASAAPPLDTNRSQLAQAVPLCQSGGYPNFYARVQTASDPLSIRQSPNGRVIGSVPSGWTLVVLEWSLDGAWARVGSHFSRYSDTYRVGSQVYFAAAPDFRDGWVSAAYLKDLGRLCEKPRAMSLLLQPELFGSTPVEVQGDWLSMGDMLAEENA